LRSRRIPTRRLRPSKSSRRDHHTKTDVVVDGVEAVVVAAGRATVVDVVDPRAAPRLSFDPTIQVGSDIVDQF
jgi:hypothetical protein